MILMPHGLQAFRAIADSGTVHAAATQLGLTQTAVTQRLKGLETALGLTLFLRSRRGMSLTADGKALLQYCRSAEELEGFFLSRVSGNKKAETSLTIVGPTSAISSRLVKDCAPIYSKYPYLRLHLQSNDPPNRIDLVRRGQADLAVIAPEDVPNEMDSKVLKPDRYLLVASHKWKGRKLHDILTEERMIDFAENDSTTMNYLKKFKLTAQRSRLFVNENEALIHLFTQGAGYGTLTESIAEPHVKAGKLIVLNRAQALEDPLALAWYPRTHKPTYFVDLIRTIK